MSDPKEFLELDYIGDYAERAFNRIPGRFRGRETYKAFIGGISDASQALEDLIFDVLTSSLLDSAKGVTLDQWGDLVNIKRDGFSDKRYRQFIKAGILIRVSTGKPDEITRAWRALTQPNQRVKWWNHLPRGFRLDTYRGEFMTDKEVRKVKRLMDRAKPAGKSMQLVEVITPVDDSGTGYSKSRTL